MVSRGGYRFCGTWSCAFLEICQMSVKIPSYVFYVAGWADPQSRLEQSVQSVLQETRVHLENFFCGIQFSCLGFCVSQSSGMTFSGCGPLSCHKMLEELGGCRLGKWEDRWLSWKHRPVGVSGTLLHPLQARVPEWVAISSSRESSQPRDRTCISSISCMYH